jgi:hypothetical protein
MPGSEKGTIGTVLFVPFAGNEAARSRHNGNGNRLLIMGQEM